jgi:RNA-dependent RNA polymerase
MKNAAVDLVKRVRVELAPPEGDPTSSLYTAWAYWSIAVALQDYFGAHSFGWIALGAIFDIIKAN